MFEIHVYASPLARTLFRAKRESNIRTGDVFVVRPDESVVRPDEPTAEYLALVESVDRGGLEPRDTVHGDLTFLATIGETGDLRPPPLRPQFFTGSAHAIPAEVAQRYFSEAAEEIDPVTKQAVRPSSLLVGTLLANQHVSVAFSAAGFNRHTVMVAQSGSGKSYGLGVILEELREKTKLRLCIFDPNGDYAVSFANTTGAPPDITVASATDPAAYDSAVESLLTTHRSCVLNLNTLDTVLWNGVFAKALNGLWSHRTDCEPTLIVIDEAHNVIPDIDPPATSAAATLLRIAAEGRKFGLWLFLASQRAQKLHRNVISQCDNLIVMRMTNQSDIEHVSTSFAGVSRELVALARGFSKGTALALGRIVKAPTLYRFRSRTTPEGGGDLGLGWSVGRGA
jgi:DNA helicase HerA-like ATPase